MATSTFDRKIEITDPESVKKLMYIMSEEAPARLFPNTLILKRIEREALSY